MTYKNKISIIIVYYNHFEILTNFLDEIYLNNSSYEYILIVNSKRKFFKKKIIKKFPNIKVIYAKRNIGFGAGINLGFKYASGETIITLNYDGFIKKKDFQLVLKKIKLRIKKYDLFSFSSKKDNSKFSINGYQTINLLGNLGISKRRPFYSEGSFLIIKKKLFNKLKGFDDLFFMYVEDIDFSWRAALTNIKPKVFKDANYIHFSGLSSGGSILKKKYKYKINYLRRFHIEKNTLRMLLKNYSTSTLFFILPLYIFQFIFENLICLLTLNFSYLKVVWKAIIWNLVNISDTFKERSVIQQNRIQNDIFIFSNMNLKFNKILSYVKIFFHNL